MLSAVKQTILADANAIYYNYPMEKLMENAGKGIAEVLLKRYGFNKRIGFFCGPGNNGGDGFVAARYLFTKTLKHKNTKIKKHKNTEAIKIFPEVYLISDAKKIRTPESRKNWQLFKGVKYDNITARDIPNHFDIIVDCLLGTGIQGKLREPYLSVVKKLNRLKAKKVSIDLPSPGFKYDFNISLMLAKVPGVQVVDIGYPNWLAEKIGVGEVKVLAKPADNSHKGDNGRLLIIAGNEQYHGALLLASKIASKIVDLVYISSTQENNEIVKKIKPKLCEFITVLPQEVEKYVKKVDAVLIGPGLGINNEIRELINSLLYKFPKKKFILDADGLKVVDKKLLGKNCIITPHAWEFKILFNQPATKDNVKKMAKKHQCIIVLKGKTDYVASKDDFKINQTGNAGMTKGGTGDVLAGLIAALACKNDLFLSACAGVFLNGLAGDRLKKRVSHYYNASDLIKEIPKTIKWCEEY